LAAQKAKLSCVGSPSTGEVLCIYPC